MFVFVLKLVLLLALVFAVVVYPCCCWIKPRNGICPPLIPPAVSLFDDYLFVLYCYCIISFAEKFPFVEVAFTPFAVLTRFWFVGDVWFWDILYCCCKIFWAKPRPSCCWELGNAIGVACVYCLGWYILNCCWIILLLNALFVDTCGCCCTCCCYVTDDDLLVSESCCCCGWIAP